jgi:1,4-dihydroxy-6-naphthoate synthase
MAGELDVSKVSFHLLGHVRDRYVLLRAGGALGRGCGPLVVSRDLFLPAELSGKRIAVPGLYTTAALLLRLYDPSLPEPVILPFHRIMPAVVSGEVDAGVIIHESRFTFPSYGLRSLVDLGTWWEEVTGHPLPLGGIVVRRSLGAEVATCMEQAIRESVRYAFQHPEDSRPYVKGHAQEMEPSVLDAHIGLYVNRFSLDVGSEGEAAIRLLLRKGEEAGVFTPSLAPLFL